MPCDRIPQRIFLSGSDRSSLEWCVRHSTPNGRCPRDASEFKDYIFGKLFLKRLSDAFEEAQEGVIAHYLAEGRSQAEAEQLASDEDEYDNIHAVAGKIRRNDKTRTRCSSRCIKSRLQKQSTEPSNSGNSAGSTTVKNKMAEQRRSRWPASCGAEFWQGQGALAAVYSVGPLHRKTQRGDLVVALVAS